MVSGFTGWVRICPARVVRLIIVFDRDRRAYEEVKEILGRDVVGEVLDEEGSTRAISQVECSLKVCLALGTAYRLTCGSTLELRLIA